MTAVLMALALAGCHRKSKEPAAMPPMPVIAAEVLVRDQPIYIERIGQTLGSRDVEIRARVEGFLESVNFSEGTAVASNALLYTIDARPFKAAYDQARGALAQTEALLDKARRDTNRLGPLWLKNAISRQQYDDALAAERNAAAANQSATAALESSQIQLDYTKIYSPIEGLVGKTEVKAGNLVGRGSSTLLTTVSEVDPISVRFSVSEQSYLEWTRKHGDEKRGQAAASGRFELILGDGVLHEHRGSITFADRQVDAETGTLLLEVSFPNPTKIVRPGQFARVRFPLEVVTNAVLVPQRAVTELQATYSVFVVGPDNKAEFRKVTPGKRVGTFYVIDDGLKPGEKVVIEGIQKLQNNSPVAPTLTNLVAEMPVLKSGIGM
jgi:membrane fusion protein (multidrug efflux system)